MKHFTQFGIVCIGLCVAGLLLGLWASDASADGTHPVCVSAIDCMVGGEPGEDPHLRIHPDIKIKPIRAPEGAGGGGSLGSAPGDETRIFLADNAMVPRGGIVVATWWRMFAYTWTRVLSR